MDKLYHFVGFGILSFLLMQVLEGHSKKICWLITIILLLGFGVGDELRQLYIPFREASLLDLVFDLLGILTGCYIKRRL